MLSRIENEYLSVEIDSLGAELQRIWDKKGAREVLWYGDPEIWKGRSPLLFPIVGRIRDDRYTAGGRQFVLPMHGFARRCEFGGSTQAQQAEFTLRDDEYLHEIYPYRFELRLNYRLEGEWLKIDYRVKNTDQKRLYFSIGAHPGFLCAAGDRIIFDEYETLDRHIIDADSHLVRRQTEPFFRNEREILLSGALFDRDALVFEHPASKGLKLLRADMSGVQVDFGGAPCLGIWSRDREDMKYVCVEPWFGTDDPVDASGKIEEKPFIQSLAPDACFNWTIGIRPF